MAPKLSPAFVTPVLDATNSNDSVPFDLNLEYEEYGPPAGGRPDAFASAGDRDPGYWIAYVMMAYQPKPTRDRDPDNEGIHTLGTCFQASYAYVFCETVRDSRPSNEPEMLKRFVVHEALHQFAIPDDLVPGVTGGLYDYDAVLNAFICPDLTPDNIERIRGNQDGPL
jgi:hypothetical protein